MPKTPILCAVQARLSSQRFPQKCFKPLCGKPLLAHVLRRCLMMQACVRTVLLVPEEDKEIFSAFLQRENLPLELFAGSGPDVLGRYENAARFFRWEGAIMRVTGDNPLIGVFLADKLAESFSGEGIAHYLGNPLGTGVEIFSRDSLAIAFEQAQSPYQREHCTPYFYENPRLFKVSEPLCPVDSPNIRVTVDTPEDLKFVQKLCTLAPDWGIENFNLPLGFTGP